MPDSKTMWTDVRREKVIHEKKYASSNIRYIMAEYFPYMDDLGSMIGCSPPDICKLISFSIRVLHIL